MGAVFKDYKAFIREDVPEIYAVPETIDGEAVTCIGERAFYGCKGLKQVILPKTVTAIGDYAARRVPPASQVCISGRGSIGGRLCILQLHGLKRDCSWEKYFRHWLRGI